MKAGVDGSSLSEGFRNGEPVANEDVVVWYGAHFTHDVTGPEVSHIVGPDLVPHNW